MQIMTDQNQPENVKYFNYLGSRITNDARCTCEIKSTISMAKAKFNKKNTLFTTKLDLNFDVSLTVHRSIFISVFNQLDAQNLFHSKFYFMSLRVSSTCAHHQEVKIALHSLWYHQTYWWPSRSQVERVLRSKHVEA